MSIVETLRQQGCRVQVDTVKTSEDKMVYEATIEQKHSKGNVYKTLDVVEFYDLMDLEKTLMNWYKDYTGKQNIKGISKFRISEESFPDYCYVDLIIQGEVSKQEFIDMYNKVVTEKVCKSRMEVAEELCLRYGFSIDEPLFEINGRYTGFLPVSDETKNSESICVSFDYSGKESESFINKDVTKEY
ncbi:hypothetical protein P9X10_03005 [Bacillus cereus]|nr:hypothetical protein [Bacillus cereus]